MMLGAGALPIVKTLRQEAADPVTCLVTDCARPHIDPAG